MPDTKNSRFVITGRTNHLAEISSIIGQLTALRPMLKWRETRVMNSRGSIAADLAATVRSLYQEELKGGTIPGRDPGPNIAGCKCQPPDYYRRHE